MWSIKFDAGESGVDDVFQVTGDGGTGVGFTRYGFEHGVGRLRGVGRSNWRFVRCLVTKLALGNIQHNVSYNRMYS